MTTQPVRLSELVATMSLVSDLGMGRPMERVLRQTVIAMRLAELSDAAPEVRAATYYTSLLTWVGCATDTSDIAEMFGDETRVYADSHDDDLGGLSLAVFVAKHLGHGSSPLRRIGMVGRFVATAGRSVQRAMQSHCLAAGDLAIRLDLGDDVRVPLVQAFERWDGKGVPGKVRKESLAPAIRLVHLADNLEAFHFDGGTPAAMDVASARRGTQFDPDLVDRFLAHADDVLDGLATFQAWDEVIALDPRLGAPLTDEQLDDALAALGDFADLKSPFRLGHSRGVAELSAGAADVLGMGAEDTTTVRRAATIHDIGMIGVPSGIWDSVEPWTMSQRERARTHPYLAERMLTHLPQLRAVTTCASQHHERLDGSGYPHHHHGASLPMTSRVLAAADVYHALREDRPQRPSLDGPAAASVLREEATAGRLDSAAVDAVLRAAGHRVSRRAALPAGLTAREAEVVALLARGRTNPEIAAELVISRKTVSAHLEHIFTKLGVTTRTEAALFAMRHGLVDPDTRPADGR